VVRTENCNPSSIDFSQYM